MLAFFNNSEQTAKPISYIHTELKYFCWDKKYAVSFKFGWFYCMQLDFMGYGGLEWLQCRSLV